MSTEFGNAGESNAPLGAVAVDSPAAPAAQNEPTEPTVIDLDENALIRFKGAKEPVKFGDYGKTFQAQATRAQQARAQIERELAQERDRAQRYEQQLQQQRQQQQQGPQQDVFAELRALPYLNGEEAVKVVQSIGHQFQQRDQIILGLARELQKLQQSVGGITQTNVQAQFESKIDKYLSDGGYGPELRDLAIETYLAYNPGPDLDEEFPRILAERVEQVQKYVAAQQRQKLEQARRQPFVPGRGGSVGPSKPTALDPRANPRQVADALWDSIQVGNNT
jgi:hypothetical protein